VIHLRALYAVAFIVLVAVIVGALISSHAWLPNEQVVALILAFGVGAGLWVVADWRKGGNDR
jgi:hypothetical protein